MYNLNKLHPIRAGGGRVGGVVVLPVLIVLAVIAGPSLTRATAAVGTTADVQPAPRSAQSAAAARGPRIVRMSGAAGRMMLGGTDVGGTCYGTSPTCSNNCATGLSCYSATDGSCAPPTAGGLGECPACSPSATYYSCYCNAAVARSLGEVCAGVDPVTSRDCYSSVADCNGDSSNTCSSMAGGTSCVSGSTTVCSHVGAVTFPGASGPFQYYCPSAGPASPSSAAGLGGYSLPPYHHAPVSIPPITVPSPSSYSSTGSGANKAGFVVIPVGAIACCISLLVRRACRQQQQQPTAAVGAPRVRYVTATMADAAQGYPAPHVFNSLQGLRVKVVGMPPGGQALLGRFGTAGQQSQSDGTYPVFMDGPTRSVHNIHFAHLQPAGAAAAGAAQGGGGSSADAVELTQVAVAAPAAAQAYAVTNAAAQQAAPPVTRTTSGHVASEATSGASIPAVATLQQVKRLLHAVSALRFPSSSVLHHSSRVPPVLRDPPHAR